MLFWNFQLSTNHDGRHFYSETITNFPTTLKKDSSANLWMYNNYVNITDWLKKRVRKFTFLKHSFFWKHTVFVNLKKFSSNDIFTSSDDILAGNFAWSNSIILVEDQIRWKRGLKHFWLTTIRVIFEIKIFLVFNKKYLYQRHTHPTLWGSVHTRCYIYNSLVHVLYVLFIFM